MRKHRGSSVGSILAAGLLVAIGVALLFSWRSHSDERAAVRGQESREKAEAAQQAEIQSAIKRKMIMIGMTCDQVSEAWGYPNEGAKKITTGQGEEERWNYTHTEHGLNGKINIQTRFSLLFSNNLLVKWEQE